jgi:hypothetical protein
LNAPCAIAAPGCWNSATRLPPSVVTWRTPTMAEVQVVEVSISMSSWLAAMAGKSDWLYLAPAHCEPDSHAHAACPAVIVYVPWHPAEAIVFAAMTARLSLT